MMNRGRKRRVIVEKMLKPKIPFIPSTNLILSQQNITNFHQYVEPYFSNRFHVELENDHINLNISPSRIRGFNITNNTSHGKIITIKATLNIDEWVDEFEKITIAKIFLLNSRGDVAKHFDYDVEIVEQNIDFDYSFEEIVTPNIIYKIIE